ncbi:MAG TPA: YfcC family protein [Candidatus Mediterraneibacter quadrami]|uniref:YfcC family protein n=1 Tax=Candidatus Mediterraneibacter quadrami TaxID=2838684 RepID=A0A9D2RE05_9FIRM|nr:YfcC family protein [Candidatus Mediterraneibacter quadrami]
MPQQSKKTTGFRMPHVFIILLLIMLFVVVLSYIIPSGTYERLENAAGITVIDPDTFHYVENDTPITFMNYFEAVYNGFVNGATIMGTLFICSGVIYLLEASGAFGAFIGVILDRTKGKEFSVVCIFYTIFVIFGVLGYGEAAYPFYPLAVTIGFRAAGLAVFYVIGLAGLYAYCRKIRRDPSLSLLSDEYMNLRKEDHTDGLEEMNIRRVLGLLAFLGVIVVQGYGCIRLGWSFPQIGAIYVILGILLALIFNIGPSEACQLFCRGAVRVFAAAFAVGLAQSVVVLMNQACIMDTIVHGMSELLQNRSAILALQIIINQARQSLILTVTGCKRT